MQCVNVRDVVVMNKYNMTKLQVNKSTIKADRIGRGTKKKKKPKKPWNLLVQSLSEINEKQSKCC